MEAYHLNSQSPMVVTMHRLDRRQSVVYRQRIFQAEGRIQEVW